MTCFPRPEVVEVEWLDSMGYSGWRKREDLERDCEHMQDLDHVVAGYLLISTMDYVAVTLGMGRGGGIGDAIQIPRCSIRRVTVLRDATSDWTEESERV